MAEVETLLNRRAAVADEITQVAGRLGVLAREELELRDRLRRAAEADGAVTNPFHTVTTTESAACSELTRAGLNPCRADPQVRLTDLVDSQHVRYAAQMAVWEQVRGSAAA
jgi:hypothetical protein